MNECADVFSLIGCRIVPAVEQLNKNPLRPFIVIFFAGAYFAVPVIAQANFIQLLAVAFNVVFGSNGRVLSGLNSILFSRQSKGIVAHGVQHIKAFQFFETGHNIRSNVTQRVTYVQAGTRRVGEHVQYIVLGFWSAILRTVSFLFSPALLPLLLYFSEMVF